MAQEVQPEALASFLFGEEKDFDDAYRELDQISSPFSPILQAFKANLRSAFRVGDIPFQLAQTAVLQKRYTQLLIAEKIRCRTKVERGQITEPEVDKEANRCASESMSQELSDKSIIERHADETLNNLDNHLKDPDFKTSAQELLRQVLVMTWSAFEILVNDTLRTLLNSKPSIIKAFADNRPYRDFLSARMLMDALEESKFNLSDSIGDVFCDVVNLDSLEKIRDAIHIGLTSPTVDIALKDERLWKISQQRNLVVHRRGLIDTKYLSKTSDDGSIAKPLVLDRYYIEASLMFIRDCGCVTLKAAHEKWSESPLK
jgi:hypothetical protein